MTRNGVGPASARPCSRTEVVTLLTTMTSEIASATPAATLIDAITARSGCRRSRRNARMRMVFTRSAVLELAVAQRVHTRGSRRNVAVVGDHHQRRARILHLFGQQRAAGLPRRGVAVH